MEPDIPTSTQIETPVSVLPSVPTDHSGVSNGKGTTSVVLGGLSLLGWLIPLIGLPLSIAGLVYGIKSLKTTHHRRAVVGIVLSAIGLLLSIVNASIGAYLGATGQHPVVNEVLDSTQP